MSKSKRYIFALAWLIAFTYGAQGDQEVPQSASEVSIEQGNILMVKKPGQTQAKPFVIKGVSWSPATRAPKDGPNPLSTLETVQYGFFFDWDGRYPQGHELLQYWLKNELSSHLSDIPLMKQMNVNTVRLYHTIGSSVEEYNQVAIEIKKVLDEFYKNDIMVIVTVAISKEQLDTGIYKEVVNAYKDHPAVLMWAIGNEWNLNGFYGAWDSVFDASARVNEVAEEIKALDTHHPVCSILGDSFLDSNSNDECGVLWLVKDILAHCPNVDIWGLNIYRGESFGNLFEQWSQTWQEIAMEEKPFFVSEFGVDSFSVSGYSSYQSCPQKAYNVVGASDEKKQAKVDTKLWNEIKKHLSVYSKSQLCLGGLIHEFNDELWKVGSYHVGLGGLPDIDYDSLTDPDHSYDDYNAQGFILENNGTDNLLIFNEEHFGLVKVDPNGSTDERIKKQAYFAMKRAFNNRPKAGSVVPSESVVKKNTTIELSAAYTDKNGWEDIKKASFLISSSISPRHCVYAYYNQNTNKLYLKNNRGNAWIGGYAPGSSAVIENSYAVLDCSKVSATGSDTTLTIVWAIRLKTAFTGKKNIYLYVSDDSCAVDGWQKRGALSVTSENQKQSHHDKERKGNRTQ